ncbi:glycosyltransferase family 22 protein [Phanerochaete sordida]|uniref:Mannosyltransferase n=1 Tax=Phanerochaete sordida TaxID=48140 RepID=A0A9P3GE08_9APHY|nr:glycosyltransferase family 22 protein [Phanerochaete sordida]
MYLSLVQEYRYELAYTLLVIARIVFAFAGMGYIHPDEYFQNGEITAGSVFGLHTLKTWEWDPSFPCRSIVPPALTTGVAFKILNRFYDNVSPAQLFRTERASSLLASFYLDIYVYSFTQHNPMLALTLLASSHVMFTFQARPFSNSHEAFTLVLAFKRLRKLTQSATITSFQWNLGMLAAIIVEGMFLRMTFAAFAAPIVLEALAQLFQLSREGGAIKFTALLRNSTPAIFCVAAAYLVYVGIDSVYFTGSTEHPVLTPYNFLLYNLSPENLAQHGIHPRWLHVAVNLPMILGPSLFVAGVYACWQTWREVQTVKENPSGGPVARINRVCAGIIIFALSLLSLQPHQEPRFLVPLVFPTTLLVANSGVIERLGTTFWVTTAVFNFALAVVFGILHQGGVVPSLFRVHELMSQSNHSSAIVYWKTYMPPRHLLAIPEADVQAGRVFITDLAGEDADAVPSVLSSLPSGDGRTDVYLVTPPFAARSLDQRTADCLKLDKRIFPHLDLDHIPESVEMGWREGLSLGIYLAELECLKAAGDPLS